jgi:hypothetical protein
MWAMKITPPGWEEWELKIDWQVEGRTRAPPEWEN